MKKAFTTKASKGIKILFIASMLVAVGPPPEGTTTDAKVGGGLNEFQTGGCVGPSYSHRTREIHGQAGVTQRFSHGGTVGVRGAISHEKVLESTPKGTEEDPNQELESKVYLRGSARLTLGWHFDHFGGDVGVVAGHLSPTIGEDVAPAVSIWAGFPDKVYGFVSLLDRPVLLQTPTVMTAGLGGSPEEVHWQFGGKLARNRGDFRRGLFGSAKFPIEDELWLGGEGSLSFGLSSSLFDASLLVSKTW